MNCVFEKQVILATKSNQWTGDLRAHTTSCPACQETIAMTTIMNNISAADTPHPLPSYRLIWLKAQYARKQERISKLDILSLAGMSILGLAGLAGLAFWRFPKLFSGIMDSTGTSALPWSNLFSNGAPLGVIAGALIIVWLLTRDSHFAER
jgi:hypothetical protein